MDFKVLWGLKCQSSKWWPEKMGSRTEIDRVWGSFKKEKGQIRGKLRISN
jgi:hypothetical protein